MKRSDGMAGQMATSKGTLVGMNSSKPIASKSTGLTVLVVVTVKVMKWGIRGKKAKRAYDGVSEPSIATWKTAKLLSVLRLELKGLAISFLRSANVVGSCVTMIAAFFPYCGNINRVCITQTEDTTSILGLPTSFISFVMNDHGLMQSSQATPKLVRLDSLSVFLGYMVLGNQSPKSLMCY